MSRWMCLFWKHFWSMGCSSYFASLPLPTLCSHAAVRIDVKSDATVCNIICTQARCGVRSSFRHKSKWQTLKFTNKKNMFCWFVQPTTSLVKKKKKLEQTNRDFRTNLHLYQSANELDSVTDSWTFRSGCNWWARAHFGPMSTAGPHGTGTFTIYQGSARQLQIVYSASWVTV